MVDPLRIHLLQEGDFSTGAVVYWMSRDQRIFDNWALLFAQDVALEKKQPLIIIFALSPTFLGATLRQYDFMIKGLKEIEKQAKIFNICFQLLVGDPPQEVVKFCENYDVSCLVTDFSPLKIKSDWSTYVQQNITIPFYEVDAHNIVPCWEASDKQEYAAYTFRPKITKKLDHFLTDIPTPVKHPYSLQQYLAYTWKGIFTQLKVDTSVNPTSTNPGYNAGIKQLDNFIENILTRYNEHRNDPNEVAQSALSPYLHFGQISPQRVAFEIRKRHPENANTSAFLEELIVRRELSDNYCYYNKNYDHFSGFPRWAQETLNEHRTDSREYLYTLEAFELAQTHDELWNAAQCQMSQTGKMHGYMRMYWAKKILEWTENPETAQKIAIYLNDKYELDGRDPNGYTGIAWSIGGVHDRTWSERSIFGKIRFMNDRGAARKFDIQQFIAQNN